MGVAVKRKNNSVTGVVVLVTLIVFILLFTYLSLNLKSIDYGYDLQALIEQERRLKEEIDRLRAEKARLLNLERVENIVIRKLGYQYPDPDQFIKVFED